MIMYDNNIKKNTGNQDTQAALTIAQLIFSHCKKKYKSRNNHKWKAVATRKLRFEKFSVLIIILWLGVGSWFKPVNRLGLTMLYTRLLQLEDQLASSQCSLYEHKHAVAPSNCHQKSFTVGVTDNLDHDPSCTNSSLSFHGTATSVFPTMSQKSIANNWPQFPLSKKLISCRYRTPCAELSLWTSTIERDKIFQDEWKFISVVEIPED